MVDEFLALFDLPPGTCVGWPDDWPKYYNANSDACDMLLGPCACGAWHQACDWYQYIEQNDKTTGQKV
jgi:hypothetical protein